MPADDICPRPDLTRDAASPTTPLATPITLASVWQCADPQQAEAILSGERPGYCYSRDGHPNADALAEKCRALHGADRAIITASGMAALAAVLVSQCEQGDHLIVSNRLYGKSLVLLASEAARLGINSTVVDTCDLSATASAFTPRTKLVVAETISNPTLRVANVAALADISHSGGAQLLVDNTFASPVVCRPFESGADFVMESLTKIMNGHSDALLGLLCGRAAAWQRVPQCVSAWGLTGAAFESWLVERGLSTLHLRAERTSANAMLAAEFLTGQKQIEAVHYPGLPSHADHQLAVKQFRRLFGSIVTFTLAGRTAAATRFIAAAKQIPFCPSLGELCTTLSHPESTSHRLMSTSERAALDIYGGTIRLSVGTESPEFVIDALTEALRAV